MFIVSNVKLAIDGWRTDPVRMIAQIPASFVVGQALFWPFGYDQLGLFMNPLVEFGNGERVAAAIYPLLPHTDMTAWTLKVIEILTDFARGPLEGVSYARHGLTPDALANVFTQPLFSTLEALEKLLGATIHPERVTTEAGTKLSLACIFGSLFRMGITVLIIVFGRYINYYLTRNIERAIHWSVGRVRRAVSK